MTTSIVLIIVGLVVLLAAGEALVRGAAGLARLASIPPLIIGLTVVAFGTSAPELVVTINAVASNAAGIAMGNIVGSNIANILLVLGLPAIIAPISMRVPRLRLHAVALIIATALFCALIYRTGSIGTFEAVVLATGMVFYLGLMFFEARSGNADAMSELEELTSDKPSRAKTALLTVAGLIGLPLGATLLVTHGEILASELGVRDEIIGLTIVAFGTSLPELATVLAAAFKRNAEVAAGSIIGSNVFNMLFVGSAAGFVGTSTFSDTALALDLPVMIGATLFAAVLIFTKVNFTRLVGILATAAYAAYITLVASTGAV